MTDVDVTLSPPQRPKPAIAGFSALSRDGVAGTHVRIVGWGLVSPLGVDAGSTWDALLAGKFICDHATAALPREGGRSRTSQLALRAAREAVAGAGWSGEQISDDQTALVVGTSKGPVELWLNALPPHMSIVPYVEAGRSDSFGLAQIATDLATEMRLGRGPKLTLSAACASGLHALIRAAMLLRSGEARRVLVVATEASVHPLFLASFQRLGVLPRPGVGCRPFDTNRDGFLMSEAAAAVCLEVVSSNGTGSGGEAENIRLERFSAGSDATHLTGGDPTGQTLRRCLAHVIADRPVDLIHAHGTGTVVNDPIELAAMESTVVTQERPPTVYSHKGGLGHSLGAAGLVAVVLNCLMHRAGQVLPNICTTHPLPTGRISIDGDIVRRPIRRSICTAAGFGGAVATVSLETA